MPADNGRLDWVRGRGSRYFLLIGKAKIELVLEDSGRLFGCKILNNCVILIIVVDKCYIV